MYNKELVTSMLIQIEEALLRLKHRTVDIHCANDFLLSPERVEKLDAVCMLFIAIGESLKSLDKVTNKELLPLYPDIPWKKVMGFRDVIAHHYFDIDAEEVWWVLENELDPLIVVIKKMKEDI
ncbi:MAG: DUF86 domain-containing protein [Parabacteroides gordonii]|jgi:uncharacterized protein with HEPN domain|uniref:HepT-like ribonuclease domain-containing protein n=1 Tax=Parabacteroides TaxID=375288 RepID=UPI000617562D|nr:DUF86 domain-containing protein [Parabacteroides sp. HGS0025]KKB50035.1 hypothetical protein HMPREF1212_03195 [Parabacteroides sp. HGS0025]